MGTAKDLVGPAFAVLEKLIGLPQKRENAKLNALLAELRVRLTELSAKTMELQDENLQLRGRVREFEKKAEIRSKLLWRDGLYYLSEPVQGHSEGPFCPLCVECDDILITLRRATFATTHDFDGTPVNPSVSWHCGRCNKRFD